MTPSHHRSAPHGLRVETGGDGFPVAPPRPELSWQLPAPISVQPGYELEATIGDESLGYQAATGLHRFIAWPWRELRSREVVQWRVRMLGDEEPWSEWATFEAGLFDGDWTSQWISSPEGQDLPVGARPAYLFRTEFTVERGGEPARLYSSALGVYVVRLNGSRVADVELAPGTESYHRTLYAQAADVSDLITPGRNVLEVELSDGWYRGKAGAFRRQAAWGPQTAIRAEIHLGVAGRSTVAVETGPDWSVHESTIVTADLMDGQVTDLTRPPRPLGPALVHTDPVVPLGWSPAPPVRVVTHLSPVSIRRLGRDAQIVDFGQNVSGRVRLANLGPKGTRTVMDFGEHLDADGDLTLTHLDTVGPDGTTTQFVQHDEVVADGRPDSVFEPRHTIHGFRYVRLSRPGTDVRADDITLQVIHSDLDQTGTFECSDPDLVRLYDSAVWSFRGNAVDIPTDCPTRERAGWTGDWQIFLSTAIRMYDVDGFSRKWLQSVRDDQLDDGRIVNISPDNARLQIVPDPMTEGATGSAGWGDAIVLVPWTLYRNYGDRRVLDDNWTAMSRWVDFALKAAKEHRHPDRIARSAEPLAHEKYIWDGTFHFGEWNEPAFITADGTAIPWMSDPMAWAMSDKGEVGTAYLFMSVQTMARIAEVLGFTAEAVEYGELADAIRDAWITEFLDDDGRTTAKTQASYVRALAFDLVPDALRERTAGHLVDIIGAAGDRLATGFLSTADLLPVLADTGHADVAHRLLLQRGIPSWLGMIDRGATTIWEEWEGVDSEGTASASLNHYSKGAVVRYLQTHTLGLRQDAGSVAWERFVVDPVMAEHLTWARGHFDSPQGRIVVEWSLESAEARLQVTVPPGATAMLCLGGDSTHVGPGSHVLTTTGSTARSA